MQIAAVHRQAEVATALSDARRRADFLRGLLHGTLSAAEIHSGAAIHDLSDLSWRVAVVAEPELAELLLGRCLRPLEAEGEFGALIEESARGYLETGRHVRAGAAVDMSTSTLSVTGCVVSRNSPAPAWTLRTPRWSSAGPWRRASWALRHAARLPPGFNRLTAAGQSGVQRWRSG